MARSNRKPFVMPAGNSSQQVDRTRASRAFRRVSRQVLTAAEPDNVVLPIRGEVRKDNRAEWSGDGAPKFYPADQTLTRK